MISLGMIVRDASATLERCLESVAPHVDEIVIGLGGESTDNTEEIVRKYTDKVIPIEWHNDFAEARNIVLKATSGDYFLWLDADDELIGGEYMKSLIEDYPDTEAFYWGYNYSQSETGECTCYLVRERLIKKSRRWKWIGAVHEVLIGPPNHSRKLVQNILVKHHPSVRAENRNLDILRSQLEETEPNPEPRVLIYLGTENANRGNFTEALVHLQRYVALSGWDEEKYQAQHRIADIFRAQGNLRKARLADFEAISIRPDWPDAYLGLAETAFAERKYRECIEWTENAGTKTAPNTFLITNPRDYDVYPLITLANAYSHLGDFEMALANYVKAAEVSPDPGILHNIKIVKEELDGHGLVDAFAKVWQHLCENDEWLKARLLFQSVPKLIEKVPSVMEKHQFTEAVTAHVADPQLMVDEYVNNPNWGPIPDETLNSPEWVRHPRVQYAMNIVKRLQPKNLVDFGSSDGFIVIPIKKEFPDIDMMGLDLDPRCVALANKRVEGMKGINFVQNDIQKLKTKKNKFDLGLAFEVIEHVVDPEAFLEKLESHAEYIALTTPYLAWESPAPNWDKKELKGHLRIFDTEDIERMLGPRGRIWNLYKHPQGSSGWIFADYRPGERTHGSVTILAPGAPEDWSPRTYELNGLGGSETAIVKLSEAFAASGKRVTVYTRAESEGYYNGVHHLAQEKFIPDMKSNLFVAWRSPELIDYPIKADHKVLWMHDTDVGDRLTPDRANRFDAIVVLTEWHKNHMLQTYPFLEPEKLHVIPNGVDVSLFEGPAPVRDPKRVVYSSSPDRGLDTILEHIWPHVIGQHPDAELHIYYGWNNIDKFIPSLPGLAEFKSKVMDLLGRSVNVVQHGRISQKQLAQEMMKSSIWLYPTEFHETYCITAVEAQLAGLIPVTNQRAALAETVKSGSIFPVDGLEEPYGPSAYEKAVVDVLDNPPSEVERNQIVMRAPAVTWIEVAARWEERWLNGHSNSDTGNVVVLPQLPVGGYDTRSTSPHAVSFVSEVRGTDHAYDPEGDKGEDYSTGT